MHATVYVLFITISMSYFLAEVKDTYTFKLMTGVRLRKNMILSQRRSMLASELYFRKIKTTAVKTATSKIKKTPISHKCVQTIPWGSFDLELLFSVPEGQAIWQRLLEKGWGSYAWAKKYHLQENSLKLLQLIVEASKDPEFKKSKIQGLEPFDLLALKLKDEFYDQLFDQLVKTPSRIFSIQFAHFFSLHPKPRKIAFYQIPKSILAIMLDPTVKQLLFDEEEKIKVSLEIEKNRRPSAQYLKPGYERIVMRYKGNWNDYENLFQYSAVFKDCGIILDDEIALPPISFF